VLIEDAAQNASIALEILGYQFPDRTPSEPGFDWDANWLMIRGNIKVADRSWSFSDPCASWVKTVSYLMLT